MGYAMCPDVGFPRLYRYVNGGPLADLGKDNLLLINKLKFDALTTTQKHRVLRTHLSID